jgi:hypothetical protein
MLSASALLSRQTQLIAVVMLVCGAGVLASTAWAQTTSATALPNASHAIKNPAALDTAWKTLTPAQQISLQPLAASWQGMSAGQKRKWLVLSKNYAQLSAQEQTKLHSHMANWASLSPQERTQARLNFAEHRALTKGLTPEQRKAQWQAYQLLSPDEKRQLAARSDKPAPGTAVAVKPSQPLHNSAKPTFGTAQVLSKSAPQPNGKIAVAPHLQKSNSLMPQTSSTVSISSPGTAQQ